MRADLSITLNFVLGAFLLALPVAILLWERRASRRRAAAAHREAAAIGLATTQEFRDLPVFERANTRVRFSPGACARSVVPLRAPAGPSSWSFQVRRRRSGDAGHGWWQLREADGKLPAAAVRRLNAEVERFELDGGFVEFAGNRGEVIAWWNDAEGPEEARRIAAVMREIAEGIEQAAAGRAAS